MRVRLTQATVLALSLLAGGLPIGGADGQRLNLDKRFSPAPGDGLGAARLSTAMDAQAKELVALPGIDPATQSSRSLRHDLRVLARDLLDQGEARGGDGSLLVIAGRRLASDMPALDAWIDSGRFSEASLREMAKDLRASISADPKQIPGDAAGLWRLLRDRLAPLVNPNATEVSAWWSDSVPSAARRRGEAGTLATALKLSTQANADAVMLDGLLTDARTHAAFASSAAQIDRSLALAAGLGTSGPGLIRLMPKLKAELEASLAELNDAEQSSTGGLRLERAALLIDIAVRTDAMKDSQSTRRLGDAVFKAVTGLASTPTSAELQRLRLLQSSLIALDAPLVARDDLDKALRPALPVLATAAEESKATLIAALARLLSADAVSTDPALVSARLSHQRRLDDVRMLSELSRAIATDGAAPKGPSPIAVVRTRVLKLSQDLSKPATRDVALTEMRTLASGLAPEDRSAILRALMTGPPPGSPLERLGQIHGAAIKRLVEGASRSWVNQAARELQARQPITPFGSELLESVEAFLYAAAARDAKSNELIGRWPAFCLTREAMGAITDPISEGLQAAERALQGGDAATFIDAARPLRGANDRVWIGVLALRAPPGAWSAAGSSMPAALASLALGGPASDAWLVEHVEEIALLCRYACELDQVDASKREGLTAYVQARGRALQNTLEAEEP